MADLIFEDSRLVSIYDAFDGERKDLENYVLLVKELGARSILDVGCGTGCLANLLVDHGFNVIGVELARASLDMAKSKPNGKHVQWILGDASKIPALKVDLAMMTGNVAQVFTTDDSCLETLGSIRKALNLNGHLAFEVRDPSKQAWLEWTRDKTYERKNIPSIGWVEAWCEVISVINELVNFRWTYVFESDGATIVSDSTLRFRERSN